MNIYYFLSDLSVIISRTIPLHYLNSCDSNGDENEDPLLHTHTHTHTHTDTQSGILHKVDIQNNSPLGKVNGPGWEI